MGFFLCLFYMFHRRYSNCRPLNSAQYNCIFNIYFLAYIFKIPRYAPEHVISWEAVMHIARVGERSPRLQIQFRISRSFRPQNLANLGSKIRWVISDHWSWFGSSQRNAPLEMLQILLFLGFHMTVPKIELGITDSSDFLLSRGITYAKPLYLSKCLVPKGLIRRFAIELFKDRQK